MDGKKYLNHETNMTEIAFYIIRQNLVRNVGFDYIIVGPFTHHVILVHFIFIIRRCCIMLNVSLVHY